MQMPSQLNQTAKQTKFVTRKKKVKKLLKKTNKPRRKHE